MIQLGDTRVGVGPATARFAVLASFISSVSYLAIILGLCGSMVLAARPLPTWVVVPLNLGGMGYAFAFLLAAIVATTMLSAEQQPIFAESFADLPPWRVGFRLAGKEFSRVLRSAAIWPTVPMFGFALSAPLIANIGMKNVAGIVFKVVIITMMMFHARAACRLTCYMRREANTPGGLFRDFDWNRIETNRKTQFRTKYIGNWKFPDDIEHPSEANRFASRARKFRFWWQTANAVTALTVVITFDPKAVPRWFAALASPDSDWTQFTTSMALVVVVCVPLAIQNHVTRLGDLAKQYEDKEVQLHGQTPDLGADVRQYISPIPWAAHP